MSSRFLLIVLGLVFVTYSQTSEAQEVAVALGTAEKVVRQAADYTAGSDSNQIPYVVSFKVDRVISGIVHSKRISAIALSHSAPLLLKKKFILVEDKDNKEGAFKAFPVYRISCVDHMTTVPSNVFSHKVVSRQNEDGSSRSNCLVF